MHGLDLFLILWQGAMWEENAPEGNYLIRIHNTLSTKLTQIQQTGRDEERKAQAAVSWVTSYDVIWQEENGHLNPTKKQRNGFQASSNCALKTAQGTD